MLRIRIWSSGPSRRLNESRSIEASFSADFAVMLAALGSDLRRASSPK